jgi:hypothetical protein
MTHVGIVLHALGVMALLSITPPLFAIPAAVLQGETEGEHPISKGQINIYGAHHYYAIECIYVWWGSRVA